MIEIFNMNSKQHSIKLYHENGFKPYDIVKALKNLHVCERQVYRVCKRLREGQSIDNRYRSGRRPTVRTGPAIKRVREQIRRKPGRSVRKMALQNKMSVRSIRRILIEHMGLYPYKKRHLHGLTSSQVEKRLTRSQELLSRHGNEDLETIVFSDEKFFGVEEKLNSQNSRIYSLAIEAIPEEMRTVQRFQKEQKVMVWCAVSKKGKFPMFFFESGERLNARNYIDKILEPIVKVEGMKIYNQDKWTFQQDSAPAHAAKITQRWCETNLPDFIPSSKWPPSSPDLNPLDYSIWGILEARVNAKRHTSIEVLKATLLREWQNLSMENVRAAIDSWPKRLKAVIKKKGGRFE